MSTYAVASARIGKNTGPGRLRSTARTSPKPRMRTSAIRNSWTFVRKRAMDSGRASAKRAALRNSRWTSGQPGALTTVQPIAPKTTTVLRTAMSTARPVVLPDRRRGAGARVMARPPRRLLERLGALVRDPLLDDGVER